MGRFSFFVLLALVDFFLECSHFCWCASATSTIGCIEAEKLALQDFKDSLTGNLIRLSSWTGQDCCKWEGVGCNNSTGHVIKLDLRNLVYPDSFGYVIESWNDFMGSSIPIFLGSMQRLRYLNLSNARFNGVVPQQLGNLSMLHALDLSSGPSEYDFQLSVRNLQWLSHISSLRRLDLSWVNLSEAFDLVQVLNKLPFLAHLRLSSCRLGDHINLFRDYVNSMFLEYFDISVNALQGPIPGVIKHMSVLKVLDLSANIFNSTITMWLANLTSLVHLNLGFNNLTGEIPSALGNLTSLVVLDLSFNSLEGGIPGSLWNLCSLKVLDLANNRLNETISERYKTISGCTANRLEKLSLRWNKVRSPLSDWFSQFANLKILDLANNSIYGPIPASFGRLSNLRILDLSHNSLNGTVSGSFGQLSMLEKLLMSSNLLQGTISEVHFANLSRLEELDIGFNSLALRVNSDWWFPKMKFSYLDLSFNQIRGRLSAFLKPDTLYMNLYLSSNKFEGPLPIFPSILNRLDLTANLISGWIPEDIGNMTPTLDNLLLSGNQISGPIPNSLCNINTLRVLDLSKNRLYGDIPDCWSNFKILAALDFSANNLSGFIPTSFGNATSLQSLHLTNNSLPGELPLSLRNCTGMVIFDVGENKLSRSVPRWVGKSMLRLEILRLRSNIMKYTKTLKYLINMDLSVNKLTGSIPKVLTNLAGLRGLNLSNNHLTGNMPAMIGNISMSALTSLSHLNLSYNKLSGRIPSGNQLQTLIDPSIYIGNPQLCGFPLLKCVSPKPPQADNKGKDEGNGPEIEWLYIFMSAGYVTGLWGVLGVMMYKKNWRDAYFNFVDDIKEKKISRFKVKLATPNRRSRTRSNHMEWSW
ncbi:hypothetical protein ACB094_02G207900 [Castanea mollissima]